MAIVTDAFYLVSVTIKDIDDNKSPMTFKFPSSNTIGNVESELTGTLIPAIEGISNGVVTGYNISYGGVDRVAPDAPPGSDVEGKAVFVFEAANGQRVKMEVPSPDPAVVVDKTQFLDPANAAVIAFVNAILTPGVDGLAPVTNTGSNLIRQVSPPKKTHRASSKG